MKWTKSFKLVKVLLLAALAAGLCGSLASAQYAVFRGNFTLPVETHWGEVVLPPGNYTLTLDTASANGRVTVLRGSNGIATLLAQNFSGTGSSRRSALIGVRDGGTYTVRALDLESLGVFYYWPPKGERLLARGATEKKRVIAQASELIQRVPISVERR